MRTEHIIVLVAAIAAALIFWALRDRPDQRRRDLRDSLVNRRGAK